MPEGHLFSKQCETYQRVCPFGSIRYTLAVHQFPTYWGINGGKLSDGFQFCLAASQEVPGWNFLESPRSTTGADIGHPVGLDIDADTDEGNGSISPESLIHSAQRDWRSRATFLALAIHN